jgi:hypothetical protein
MNPVGKAGEREAAALVRDLTGWDMRRRVRQHECDSDLEGVPGWCIEVKRHRAASRADLATWWAQAVTQAAQAGNRHPVLLYRVDRADWRAVWPMALLLGIPPAGDWLAYMWTADTTGDAWAAVARELLNGRAAA